MSSLVDGREYIALPSAWVRARWHPHCRNAGMIDSAPLERPAAKTQGPLCAAGDLTAHRHGRRARAICGQS